METQSEGTLVPYVYNGVLWSIPDEKMLEIYKMFEEHRIKEKLFFGMDMTVQKFFRLIKDASNQIHVIFDAEERPVFMAWLNSFGYNYAFAHYTGFPWSWGRTKPLIRQTLDYWFSFKRQDGAPILDVLFGLTPADNRLAVRTALRTGFKVLGTVPQIQFGVEPSTKVGGVFTTLGREEYYGRQ